MAVLLRQPETKESRYAHLPSEPVESLAVTAAETAFVRREGGSDAGQKERIARLEASVVELRQEMAELRRKFDDLFADG